MKNIQTEVIIQAPVDQVWQKLIAFQDYQNWNPFIVASTGQAKVGERITNTMQLDGQKKQVFRPRLLAVQANRQLRWLGHFWFRGLFDGEHYFQLEAVSDGKTKLIHGEHFSGLLVGLVWSKMKDQVKAGFIRMNEALKRELEEGNNKNR